jgi:hypothetical protein
MDEDIMRELMAGAPTGRTPTPRPAARGVKAKRRRARVKNSWRDLDKGNCYTRYNKAGGAYVVCEGSEGQKKGKRSKRGDPDQKGRSKTEAIRDHTPMMRKYDDKGKLIYERQVERMKGKIHRVIPLRQEGNRVYFVTEQPEHTEDFRLTGGYIKRKHKKEKSLPVDKFNAQYRIIRKGGKNFNQYSLK